MKEQKKCVPEIRFAGFTDDWEQRKLGDVLTESRIIGSNGAVAKKLTVKLWKKGVIAKEEQYAGSLATQYFARKSGQFIYGKLDFLNQAFGIIPKELDGYESTLDSPAFDISKQVNENFLLEYIARDSFYLLHGNIANGSRKAKRIHSHTLLNMPFIAPNLEEQTAIGNFFKQLDDTIALHRRNCIKCQNLKMAYLESIFSAKYIHYKDRNKNAWEQRKLGDISQSYSGGTPSVGISSFYGGSIPFIRSGEINDEKTELFLTEKGLHNSSAKLVKYGDILYALYGATSGEVNRSKINGAINQAILAIIPNLDYCVEFIAQWLRKNKLNIISTYLQGGQGNLSAEIVKNLQIILPDSKEEQTAIGNFFKQLDDTIALHQREVEKYKKIKQAYLEKMFI